MKQRRIDQLLIDKSINNRPIREASWDPKQAYSWQAFPGLEIPEKPTLSKEHCAFFLEAAAGK